MIKKRVFVVIILSVILLSFVSCTKSDTPAQNQGQNIINIGGNNSDGKGSESTNTKNDIKSSQEASKSETAAKEESQKSEATQEAKTSEATTNMEIPKISIVKPIKKDLINPKTDIEYKIEGKLPEGTKAFLLVRDPTGVYWSWGSSNGHKHSNVQIGNGNDSGSDFEITIIITDQDLQLGSTYNDLPEGIAHESIIVTRK